MVPLILTVMLAVYILGQYLVSQWILALVVPRRAVVQSRSEEIARAILWSLLPLCLS